MKSSTTSSPNLLNDMNSIIRRISAEDSIVILPSSLKPYLYSHIITRIGSRFLAILPNGDDAQQAATALTTATKFRIVSYVDSAKRIGPAPNFLITTPNALAHAQDRQHLQQHTQRIIILDDIHELHKHPSFPRINTFIFSAGTAPSRIIALICDDHKDFPESNAIVSSLCLTQAIIVSINDNNALQIVCQSTSAKKRRPHRTDIRHTVPGTLTLNARTGSPAEAFFRRVTNSAASPYAKSLHTLVSAMEANMNRIRMSASPLFNSSVNHNPWTHFIDSVNTHGVHGIASLEENFSQWKQALDVLVRTWEQADWASVVVLRQGACDSDEAINIWPSEVATQIRAFWKGAPFNHQPLFRLRGVTLENSKALVQFRLVVVVDFPVLAHAVEYYFKKDTSLKQFRPVVVYAVDGNPEECCRLTSRQARLNLDNYSTNQADILITTADYEQHNELPDASCVIRLYSGAEVPIRYAGNKKIPKESTSGVQPLTETQNIGGPPYPGMTRLPDPGSAVGFPDPGSATGFPNPGSASGSTGFPDPGSASGSTGFPEPGCARGFSELRSAIGFPVPGSTTRFPHPGSAHFYPTTSSMTYNQDGGHPTDDLARYYAMSVPNLAVEQREGLSVFAAGHYSGNIPHGGMFYGGGSSAAGPAAFTHEAVMGTQGAASSSGSIPGYSFFGQNYGDVGTTGGPADYAHGYPYCPNQAAEDDDDLKFDPIEPVRSSHQGREMHSIENAANLHGSMGVGEQGSGHEVGNNVEWNMSHPPVNTETTMGRDVPGCSPGIVKNWGLQIYGDWNPFRGMMEMPPSTSVPATVPMPALEALSGSNVSPHEQGDIGAENASASTVTNECNEAESSSVPKCEDDAIQTVGRKKRGRGGGRGKRGSRMNRYVTGNWHSTTTDNVKTDQKETDRTPKACTPGLSIATQTPLKLPHTQATQRQGGI